MKAIAQPVGRLIAAGICLAILARAEPALAPDNRPPRYVIGLSPFLDRSVKDAVYRRIVGLLLEDVPLGSSLSLYDAYDLSTIAQIDVPAVRAFASAKTRANQFKEPIRKLKDFLAMDHQKPWADRSPPEQAIRLPQFLDFVGDTLCQGGRAITVIVLGSPLYVDAKEPGFSMVDGYFPSDGHLLASREQSVYGLKGRTNALKEVVVHLGYFGDPWVSDVHQEKIRRFWSLYLQGQGAQLATFCGDLPTVFNAARAPLPSPVTGLGRYALDPGQTKIEMLRITRNVGVAEWITRETLPNPRPASPTSEVGPMKIGIRWSGPLDLDLYASATPHSETLFFEHTRCPEGYYFKDYRSSPDHEYEFIEFTSPVNVWQVAAMVNFYQGSAPGGPTGEIRIEFGGQVYSGPFAIQADHGNEGRSGTRQAAFWTRIDIPRILRLPGTPLGAAARN